MDLESLKKSKDYLAAQMAYYSAANAVTLGEASGALAWPMLGADRRDDLGSIMTDYAAFVRANPSAPAEALFRFGAGRTCHDEGHGNWRSIDFVWRIAFTVFHRMLPICDQLFAEEIAALETAAWVDTSPRQAAALSIAAEDTILETHGSIFEISPNMRLQVTSSPPTMSILDVDDQTDAAEGTADGDQEEEAEGAADVGAGTDVDDVAEGEATEGPADAGADVED